MRKLLTDEDNNSRIEMSQKYPHGYVILGVANGKIVYEPNFNSIKVDADWDNTTLTINQASKTATFFFPHLRITADYGDFILDGNRFTVSYVDNKLTMISFGVTAIWVEVLDVNNGIFLIGFK